MIDVDDDNLWRVNLFEILGVSEDVSKDDLKNVYKSLAKQYHPDRFPAGSAEQNAAKEKFSDINKAYDVLGNDAKRSNYLDTRRLLAEHLITVEGVNTPDTAPAKQATQTAASPTPAASTAAKSAPKKNEGPKEDAKLKQAEEAFKEGNSLFNKSDLDGAITAFQRAISVLPDTGKFHSALGRAYLMKGWKGMAQSAFKQALVLNPNDPVAKKHYEPEKAKKKGLLDGLFGKFKKD